MNRLGHAVRSLILGSLLIAYSISLSGCSGNEASGALTASGFIEAEEIDVASELGGRVVELLVEEGDKVEPGAPLVRLDGRVLAARADVADASLEVARARRALALAGARAEEVARARAGLALAEATRDGACRAWQDALAIRANPQGLNVQIARAEAQLASAEATLARATALKDAAEIGFSAYEEGVEALEELEKELSKLPSHLHPSLPGMPLQFHAIPYAHWKAWVGVNAAQAARDGARAALEDLYAMRDDPRALNVQVNAAETECNAASAGVQVARAALDALQAGATDEEVDVLEAQVAQAQAALDALLVLQQKLTVSAPAGGLVLEISIREGELAAPGATLLTLGDLDRVTLTVYVPEDRLGRVHVGQKVGIRVDSFPDRSFTGSVAAIAHEAEFTPRNVQTQEERVNMVFAVDVHVPNPDHALKPGLPADAVIEEGSGN
jgi:multidrug efflux pump subunit AcrA (membrane-fusion protein)